MSAPVTNQDLGALLYEEHVSDRRETKGRVSGAPLLYTPGGRNPIEPGWVEVDYRRSHEPEVSIHVGGKRLDRPAFHPYLVRRVKYAEAPEWVREFVERHRPVEWTR